MKTLRREIHPVIRVLDANAGLVEYVASDETLDSYNEAIKADGWRFDRFQKNAPFVDSHNYASIDCLLGRVVEFQVKGKRLVETVRWAIDVPSNVLAQKGFEMTAAGYLKAVSVGFMPVRTLTAWSDSKAFQEMCAEMGISEDANCRCIYLEQQQMELSACVIGANPNAVAQIEKAYHAGILDDSDIDHFSKMSPDFAHAFEQRSYRPRAYSFGRPTNRKDFAEKMSALAGTRPPSNHEPQPTMKTTTPGSDFSRLTPQSKTAFETVEILRSGQNETELERAVRLAFHSLALENRAVYGNPIERYLNADPERRYFWNGIARKLGIGRLTIDSPEYRAVQKAVSGINLQDTFGPGLLESIPIGDGLYDLLLHYGQYKYLGLRKMIGAYTKYAQVTGFPDAIFITPNNQGKVTLQADASLTGAAIAPLANTIAALIEASYAWLQDKKIDLSEIILSKFIMGLSGRIDYGAFQGNGDDDTTNGMTKGIFFDPAITPVPAPAGAIAIGNLMRQDFINVTAKIAPAALQRMDEQPPRWYISPALIPQLLLLWDDQAKKYLLKTPAETGGEWLLVGFPVTWAAQAPSASVAGSKIAAFGNPDAYLVALHERFEITSSAKGAGFAAATVQFRAIGRGFSQLREKTGFATLQLSAD